MNLFMRLWNEVEYPVECLYVEIIIMLPCLVGNTRKEKCNADQKIPRASREDPKCAVCSGSVTCCQLQ